MQNAFSYMRISTKEERAKQTYSRQEKALEKWAKEHHIEFIQQFKEDESGKSFKGRKEWQKLERIAHPGDIIVFKDLCRFTRETEHGFAKYMELMERGINLVFIDNPTVSTDYMKNLLQIAQDQPDTIARESLKFIARILLIAELDRAEKERIALSQRTKDGLAAHKAQAEAEGREWHCGRPKGHLDKMTPELASDIQTYLKNGKLITLATILKRHKISRNTLKKYITLMENKN